MPYSLGADLGTTAVKVALFDEGGRAVARCTREYTLDTPSSLRVELDPEVYWRAFREALHAVLATPGVSAGDVACLGVSAQGETLVLLDRAGRPLRPAIVWMDNRAQAESDFLAEELGNEQIHRVTGQVSMLPMWPAAKLLWLRRHEEETFRRADRFLLTEDWLIHRLTGACVAEGSLLCSTTWWELGTRRYWPRMLELLGVEERRLPEVVEPGQRIATLRPGVAAELGLSPRTVVCTGALDQACGAIGAGNIRAGIFSECTGSNVAVVTLVDRPTIDANRQLPCFYYGLPGTYMMHAFSMTGGMVLRWLRDRFGGDPYEALTAAAAAVPAGAEGLVLLPHFQGAGLPESNPKARGVLYGLSLHHTKAHVTRAILESIAMTLHRMIDAVRDMGLEVREVRSLGGGAKSDLWCQIKADVTRLPVVTTRGSEDAACLGAAMLAGVAAGVWPSVERAVADAVALDRSFTPAAGPEAVYGRGYALYRSLYDRLLPIFESGTDGAAPPP